MQTLTTRDKLHNLETELSNKKQLSKTDFYNLFTLAFTDLNETMTAEGARVPKKYVEAVSSLIESILSPKTTNSLEFPPKEIEGVMHYRCKMHEVYYPADKMVISNGVSKGYCKPVWAKWCRTNDNIKKLEKEVSTFVLSGDFEKAQALAKDIARMKEDINKPSFYDAVKDWEEYKPRVDTAEKQ